MQDGVRMRLDADFCSPMIDGADLPVGFVAEQIAPVQPWCGVERVKIRDRSGKEGWVTPDARPKGGQVFFTKVDTGADGVRRFMQFKRREDGPDSRSYLFSSPDSRSEVRFVLLGVHFHVYLTTELILPLVSNLIMSIFGIRAECPQDSQEGVAHIC